MKRKNLLGIFILLLLVLPIKAQDSSLEYLHQQCPTLTELYSEELENCHAHYLFAVDVSLSMCKYESTVRPALEAFVKALPNGDRVTIIPFAHDANANKLGFDVIINGQTKNSLIQLLPSLYPQGTDKKDKQYFDTDVFQAQQAVAASIQQNAQYDVNIIIFISDLLHCPVNNIDRQFSETEMNDMLNKIRSAKNGAENLVFTLELPQSGSPSGYVFPQLQEIYKEWDVKVEQQQIPDNSEALIRQWFDQQKNRIMFTKLQTIIIKENKANPIVVRTETNIDGKMTAHIEWKAGKLYPKLTLDSTYITGSKFYFKANPEYIHLSKVGEMNEDLDLGQIKHESFGFHKMADTIHFEVKLPVEYQGEIDKLLEGRPGAIANTSEFKDGLVFTFFLPLWLTIVIAILLVLYVIGIFKAIVRNASYCFKGDITVYYADGRDDEKRRLGKMSPSASLIIGQGGSPSQCKVDEAEWQISVVKKCPSIFMVFSKPYFEWKRVKGYVVAGKAQSGKLSYEGNNIVKLKCGASRDGETHSIKIQLQK